MLHNSCSQSKPLTELRLEVTKATLDCFKNFVAYHNCFFFRGGGGPNFKRVL